MAACPAALDRRRALVALLLTQPERGLDVFWQLAVPILPYGSHRADVPPQPGADVDAAAS